MRLFSLISFLSFVFASPPDWTYNPNAYEFTASMTAVVYDEDGAELGDDGDLLGAFDAADNVRGVAELIDGIGPYAGVTLHTLSLHSNVAADVLSFQYYDFSEDVVYNIQQTVSLCI